MAVTRPSPPVPDSREDARLSGPSRIVPPGRRTVARTVGGPVRAGRRTKLLVKHLLRGDIALIDHEDIDRVSAEELIAAGVLAVLNCGASSSGAYPNLGPQLLVEAGILLVDLSDDALFEQLSDGDPLVVVAEGPAEGPVGEVLRRG
jgi:uncharacterized membrane-anchored protein